LRPCYGKLKVLRKEDRDIAIITLKTQLVVMKGGDEERREGVWQNEAKTVIKEVKAA
jgi:hypothetical protein